MFFDDFDDHPMFRMPPLTGEGEEDWEEFSPHRPRSYFKLFRKKNRLITVADSILAAAKGGNPSQLQRCLPFATRADLRCKEPITRTPVLIVAARMGFTDIVRLLLAKGAKADQRDTNSGGTALIHASMHGHIDTVYMLLVHNANVDAANYWGITALMVAARYGHAKVVRLLLLKGANATALDNDGHSASELAADDHIRTLLQRRVNPHRTMEGSRYHMSSITLADDSDLEGENSTSPKEVLTPAQKEVRFMALYTRTLGQVLRTNYLHRRTQCQHHYATVDLFGGENMLPVLRHGLLQIKQAHLRYPQLTEDNYATLPARHAKLVKDLENKCRELMMKNDFTNLKRMAKKLEEMKALDISPYL